MKSTDLKAILSAAKRNKATRARLYKDPRYIRVIGFLTSKGYLTGPKLPSPKRNTVLDLVDVLWVADRLEPRVLEVLPAALLHFPGAFTNYDRLPEELRNIINAIRRGIEIDISYRGIRSKDMSRWANLSPEDRRVKPVKERRRMKSFRLAPKTLDRLQELAKAGKISETEALERLINQLSLH